MKKFFTRALFFLMSMAVIMPSVQAMSIVKPSSTDPDPATVKAALAGFRNLSKKEKRERFKEVRKEIKAYNQAKREHRAPIASTVVQVIFGILIPPLGVFLHEGVINSRFWIDLLLTLIFYITGLIYALIVILGDTSKE